MQKLDDILSRYRPAVRDLTLSNPGVNFPDPRDLSPLIDAITAIEKAINEKLLIPDEIPNAYGTLKIYKPLLKDLLKQAESPSQ